MDTMALLFILFLAVGNIYMCFGADLCLGIPKACDATLQDITLAGSHNSGAGFDGLLYHHNPLISVPAASCWFRNQMLSIYDQLKLGVRYLDIDTCYEGRSKYQPNGAWTCHNGPMGGPVAKMLDQVDKWINEPENKNEVVVIHFNRDFEKKNKEKIGRSLIKLLKERWEPTTQRKLTGNVIMADHFFQKLGSAIRKNQRIFVILHGDLAVEKQPYFFTHDYVGYTWTSMTWLGSNNCKELSAEVAKKCTRATSIHPFVRLDLFLSSGLCVDDLAKHCNALIDSTSKKCYRNIHNYKPSNPATVNFIVVDYIGSGLGRKAISVAKELTKVHLQSLPKYLRQTILAKIFGSDCLNFVHLYAVDIC